MVFCKERGVCKAVLKFASPFFSISRADFSSFAFWFMARRICLAVARFCAFKLRLFMLFIVSFRSFCRVCNALCADGLLSWAGFALSLSKNFTIFSSLFAPCISEFSAEFLIIAFLAFAAEPKSSFKSLRFLAALASFGKLKMPCFSSFELTFFIRLISSLIFAGKS